MILEVATLDVDPAKTEGFESEIDAGIALITRAKGCLAVNLYRCQEQAARYQLHVQWETLEHHTVTFRQSEDSPALRAILGRFLASPPAVQHYAKIR